MIYEENIFDNNMSMRARAYGRERASGAVC